MPAKSAVGRFCWDVVAERHHGRPDARCARCPGANGARSALARDARSEASPPMHCAILPLSDPSHGALVWFPPVARDGRGFGSAWLEAVVIRGALAERLGSIESTLEGLRRVCAADDCELFVLDTAGKEVFLVDCEGYDREAFMQLTHMPLGAGYPGTVTLLQKPLFTNRFQKDRLFLRGEVKRCGIRSFLGVPLVEGGRPLGYVGVGWRDGSVPMEWGVRVLEAVRSIIPLAVPRRVLPTRCTDLPSARLALRCFGPFEIFRSGQKLAPDAFARRKALQLLKQLVLRRGIPVHRDRLVELLWPEASPRAGANRLHGVVNALRSAIESGRGARASEYIVCRDDHYFFNTEAPHSVDLFDFLDFIATARSAQREGAEQRALGLLEDAVRLFRGDLFADDTEDESLETHRVRLRHMYLDAARSLAAMRIRWGHTDEAIWTLRTALDFEPVALDLYELLVAQLASAGRVVEARQQYECCRAALRKHLDMEPPARIRALEKLLH
ncbi:MAG: GAF domain-containing protein [Burkholderiales bacterium]|nr:GAF domain-containing protein [Burkholderiales bacterium]